MSSGDEKIFLARKRGPKTSRCQFEIFVSFLERNPAYATGKVDPSMGREYTRQKFMELCDLLNSSGRGPVRSIDSWKILLKGWKNQTRAKARKIKAHAMEHGEGSAPSMSLSSIEERAIAAWGPVSVNGNPDLPSVGMPVKMITLDCNNGLMSNNDIQNSMAQDSLFALENVEVNYRNEAESADAEVSYPAVGDHFVNRIDSTQGPPPYKESKSRSMKTEPWAGAHSSLASAAESTNKILERMADAMEKNSVMNERMIMAVEKLSEGLSAVIESSRVNAEHDRLRLEVRLAEIQMKLEKMKNNTY